MNEAYTRYEADPSSTLMTKLQSLYIRIFGIPEIGFQLRAFHFKQISRKFGLIGANRILDAGSGIGAYTIWLAATYPECHVVACDTDEAKVKYGTLLVKELNLPNVEFILDDVISFAAPSSSFDLVLNIDVLEHLPDYRSALKSFYRLLKPGGYLYLHTPQPDQPRIFRRFRSWEHQDHVFEGFTPNQLEQDLNLVGFGTAEITETFHFFGRFAWEVNHLALMASLPLAGATYPLLYGLARLDALLPLSRGLATAVLAQKPA